MTGYELLVTVAAQLASSGTRSLPGSVAAARELLDLVRQQEPELAGAHDRARVTEGTLRRAIAQRRPTEP